MAQYLTPNNIRWFAGGALAGAKYYDEVADYVRTAKNAGAQLRQRYNRYYYTGSLKQKYYKPLGATNSTRTVARKTVRMPGRGYSKRPMRRMMRRRRVYRRRISKKTRWQGRARRMVGNARNFSTSKTRESIVPSDVLQIPTKFVSMRALIDIPGTSTSQINRRSRDMCVISGIKLELTFKNLLTVRGYVNWAVVHPKQGQVMSDTTPDFFRDYTDERAFNTNASAAKTGLTYSVAQINTDEFVVMKRGKFMLTPGDAAASFTANYNYGGSTKELSCWIKLGRSFYFDDGQQVPQDQIYFVTWFSNPDEGVGTTNDAIRYRLRSIIYFREPRTA